MWGEHVAGLGLASWLARAAQHGLYAHEHQTEGEGLGDIVVGLQLKGLYLRVLAVQGGEHDDGDIRDAAYLLADGVAVEPGHP